MTENEGLILLNQAMIMNALSTLVPSTELRQLLSEQAERMWDKVTRHFGDVPK